MITFAFLGMMVGAGLWLVARGLRPAPMPLDVAVRALSRPRREAHGANGGLPWFVGGAIRASQQQVRRRADRSRRFAQDLAITERTPEHHAVDQLTTAVFGAGVPVGCWTIAALGGAHLPVLATLVATALFAVGGWFLADVQLHQRAQARRVEFTTALSTYLDLVAILLAGGSGIEQALRDAAGSGETWPFALIGRCLNDAALQGRSPWRTMADVAERTDLVPLAEMAAGMSLAGESGARTRESLVARAATLRAHELHDIEAKAAASTEKMGGPVAFMVVGFVLLIGYPAFATIAQL